MVVDILLPAVVQAVTEFLPISSSGHLVLLHDLFRLDQIDTFRFDVALHWGTLLAVILYFSRDLLRLARAWVVSFRAPRRLSVDARIAWLLLLGTIPPAILGILFEDVIQEHLRTPFIVVMMLILGGLALLWAERQGRRERTMQNLSVADALIVGTSQALAFIPGVSRSGITIIAALLRNMKRPDAVRFSFLLSVPVVFAAGALQLLQLDVSSLAPGEGTSILIGALVTAGCGLIVIHYFLRFVTRHSFRVFGFYRIILALAVAGILLVTN